MKSRILNCANGLCQRISNVDEPYYFEEIETPDGNRMLYAISLSQGVKGFLSKRFLIDTCKVYMDNISTDMMEKLNQISDKT